MRLLALLALMLLVPVAAAEANHNPQEVDDGDLFQAWIDVDESYEEVRFYVCTLAKPFTCYASQKVPRDEAEANGDGTYRYSFNHTVTDAENDDGSVSVIYPGYRYELCVSDCKEENNTKAPNSTNDNYPRMEIVELMGDSGSYYFKVERKAAPPAEEDEGLPAVALPVAAIAMAWVARRR